MNARKVAEILRREKQPVITVFGDYCLDRYLYIDAARDEVSVETGLTAFQVARKRYYAGAAGTITNNLRALGASVYCVGILGDDGDGWELERSLKKVGADTRYMVHTDERNTCTYVKPLRCENGSETEINRLDIRNFTKTPMAIQEELINKLKEAVSFSDAVIICDQFEEEDFAAVTAHIRDTLGEIAEANKEVLFYTDSRMFADKFHACIVKCNQRELARIYRVSSEMDADKALEYAKLLYEKNRNPVYVTMGEYGSVVFDGSPHKIPALRAEGPLDIVGAGDAFNAGAVYALSKGADFEQAALAGNIASSIVIKQIGVTGTAKFSDILIVLDSM